MNRTVYQLHASGPLRSFKGRGKIVSGKVFVSITAARNHEAAFRVACTTDAPGSSGFSTLDTVDGVAVLPLELIESE